MTMRRVIVESRGLAMTPFDLHTTLMLPNGRFLALAPHAWPHWYWWDCACGKEVMPLGTRPGRFDMRPPAGRGPV
jgi:hypothetical protein